MKVSHTGHVHVDDRPADAVAAARQGGLPWSRIGKELGVSAQAAQQRYGLSEATT